MPTELVIAIRVATVIAWAVAACDLTPALELPANTFLFIIAIACVGAYATIAAAHARPSDEVYLAGKEIGRREMLLEIQSEKVTRLDSRRLRAVDRA